MRAEWSTEDLVGSWTLVDEDWRLVGNKSGPTRLGFALLLKFFELEACFPSSAAELPEAAVSYVAQQASVEPESLAEYDWAGRAIKRHRVQIRNAFGFREFSRATRTSWLTGWPPRCARSSCARSSCSRRCWCAAGLSGWSRPAAPIGSRGPRV